MTHVRYCSMFSGIGGFELGIERSAQDIGLTAECVGYSEIDKHAIKTYEEHFNHDNYGDATAIDAESIPDHNLLVGGFPCQTFSIAGGRKGFDEARGTLFFDIARILKAKLPRFFILENVKGLDNHGARTGVVEGGKIRRLTPTECERLQGFPDGWTIGADSQRYKQCGNAVTVNVVHDVARQVLKEMAA